jgi:hypothetical protein
VDETPRSPDPRWWRINLYPATFPAAFVVVTWASVGIHPAAMYRPLIIAIAGTLILTLILSGVFRDRDRGALLATAIVCWAILGTLPLASVILLGAILLFVVEAIRRHGRPLKSGGFITKSLSVFGAIILVASVLEVAESGALARAIEDVRQDATPRSAAAAPRPGTPEIYVVLLDGYPGDVAAQRALAAGSAYDPDAFPTAMTQLGFSVQRESHSNYLITPESLASMFAMRHLAEIPRLSAPFGTPREDAWRVRRAINDGEALDSLHAAGYELVSIASGFSEVEIRHVDRWIDTGQPTEYEISLLRLTALGSLLTTIAPDALSGMQRDRITSVLNAFETVAAEPHDKPRFVFVHVPAPHAPWVFGPNGEPRRDALVSFFSDPPGARGLDRSEALRRAFDQATYVGAAAAGTIGRVLRDAQQPPVVVVFSDHGTGTGFDFADPLHSDLAERSSNFFATSTPGLPDLFASPTTPVNIFPTLLDGYFGLDIPMAANSVYAWTGSTLNLVEVDPEATAGAGAR